MSNHENEPGAAVVAAIMEKYHQPGSCDVKDPNTGLTVPVLFVPGVDGVTVKSVKSFLDEWRTRPERMRGTTRLDTAQSLIDHANRFKNDQSVLFCHADRAQPSIRAIYNYDDAVAGDVGLAAAAEADWNDHIGAYRLPLSEEWQKWLGVHGKDLEAADFAEFLEDHILDVMPYDAAAEREPIVRALGGKLAGADTVMALSRGVQVFATNEVQTKINLSSGEATLIAREEHRDDKGAPVKIPNLLRVCIPVFDQGDPVPVFVRLRYRVRGSSVRWSFMLHDVVRVFDTAVRAEAERVAAATALPLLFGSL
ncbi:MAG: DUF2303 family protein [Minwuia sp.]|nr:DUF2303 family protein [Minwuia sp.]